MQTINVGPMFGANEVTIHVLDKSEQDQKTHGFILSSGKCITVQPHNVRKIEEYCLRAVTVEKRDKNDELPIYLDVVIDYDFYLGIQIASCVTTRKNRVTKIRCEITI